MVARAKTHSENVSAYLLTTQSSLKVAKKAEDIYSAQMTFNDYQ